MVIALIGSGKRNGLLGMLLYYPDGSIYIFPANDLLCMDCLVVLARQDQGVFPQRKDLIFEIESATIETSKDK